MPCRWRRAGDQSWRTRSRRSPMPMTSVVRVMTTTYRVKDPADAALPCSFEARSPQGTGPFAFSTAGNARRRPIFGLPWCLAPGTLFNNSHRVRCRPTPATHSHQGRRRVRPAACPISGVPTHKHRPVRCACALGRPPVACSDASPACAGRPRRVWTQPRWISSSLVSSVESERRSTKPEDERSNRS